MNHNTEYKRLFGDSKPKMHFMTHNPKLLSRNGPFIHFWGMPFERKNKQLKEFVEVTKSTRKLPHTIAINNRLQLCHLKEFSDYSQSDVSVGKIIGEVPDAEIKSLYPKILGPIIGQKIKSIDVLNKTYSTGIIFFNRYSAWQFCTIWKNCCNL